jgi:hypothetical protein
MCSLIDSFCRILTSGKPLLPSQMSLVFKFWKKIIKFINFNIRNEYIKSTSNQFINIYEKLFNIIFDKGFVPHIWLIGTIKPIYKNKGDIYEPKNKRKESENVIYSWIILAKSELVFFYKSVFLRKVIESCIQNWCK